RPGQRGVDPIGLTAMLVCAAALGCVWSHALCFLVLPAAVAGLVTGLVALAAGLLADRPRYVLAAIGCAGNALVTFAALFYPAMLGPTYEMSRARTEVDVVVPRAVALPGQPANTADA